MNNTHELHHKETEKQVSCHNSLVQQETDDNIHFGTDESIVVSYLLPTCKNSLNITLLPTEICCHFRLSRKP